MNKGWPKYYIDSAFNFLDKKKQEQKKQPPYPGPEFGSSITLFLDDELRTALEKRAKKNMLTLPEQVEDILRRSTLSMKGKKSLPDEKLDDKLVGLFSRKNTGQKTKKKKAKKEKKSVEELERKAKRKAKIQKRHARKDRKEHF